MAKTAVIYFDYNHGPFFTWTLERVIDSIRVEAVDCRYQLPDSNSQMYLIDSRCSDVRKTLEYTRNLQFFDRIALVIPKPDIAELKRIVYFQSDLTRLLPENSDLEQALTLKFSHYTQNNMPAGLTRLVSQIEEINWQYEYKSILQGLKGVNSEVTWDNFSDFCNQVVDLATFPAEFAVASLEVVYRQWEENKLLRSSDYNTKNTRKALASKTDFVWASEKICPFVESEIIKSFKLSPKETDLTVFWDHFPSSVFEFQSKLEQSMKIRRSQEQIDVSNVPQENDEDAYAHELTDSELEQHINHRNRHNERTEIEKIFCKSTPDNKKTIIYYHPGCYGSLLEWCMYYFSGHIDKNKRPWAAGGSAHGSAFDPYINVNKCLDSIRDNVFPVVKCHPGLINNGTQYYDIKTAADFSIDRGVKVIQVFRPESFIPMQIANMERKISKSALRELEEYNTKTDMLLSFFGKKDYSELTENELRECVISLTAPTPSIHDYYREDDDMCMTINVWDIFDDFESTIRRMLKFIGFTEVRSNYQEIFNEWISLQQDKHLPLLVEKITNAISQRTHFDWSDTPLDYVQEAALVYMLRANHWRTVDCTDDIPTNSTDLLKIIKDHNKAIDVIYTVNRDRKHWGKEKIE